MQSVGVIGAGQMGAGIAQVSAQAGYHVLLFPGDPLDPLSGYDDLLRATAVDAFVVTDTYLGNPQAS